MRGGGGGGLAGIKRALRSRAQRQKNSNKLQRGRPNGTRQGQDESESESSVFERQYDRKMGHFYTCPCCYQRYVSSECVEEHLEQNCPNNRPIPGISSSSTSSTFLAATEEQTENIPKIVSCSSLQNVGPNRKLSEASATSSNNINNGSSNIDDHDDDGVEPSMLQVCISTNIFENPEASENGEEIISGDIPEIPHELNFDTIETTNNFDLSSLTLEQLLAEPCANYLPVNTNLHAGSSFSSGDLQGVPNFQNSYLISDGFSNGFGSNGISQAIYQSPLLLPAASVGPEPPETDEFSSGGYNCPTCNGYCETIEGLREHINVCIAMPSVSSPSSSSTSVSNPTESTSGPFSLRPKAVAAQSSAQSYQCRDCKTDFDTEAKFQDHNLQIHGKHRFICQICGSSCVSKRNLKIHSRIHTGEKTHKCPHCPQSFLRRTTMLNHSWTHEGSTSINCPFPGCNAGFRSMSTYTRHRLLHKIKKDSPQPDGPTAVSDGSIPQKMTELAKKY